MTIRRYSMHAGLLVAGLAAITSWSIYAGTGGSGHTVHALNGGLFTSNRDAVEVCVSDARGDLDAAASAASVALERLRASNEQWVGLRADGDPVVHEGCPDAFVDVAGPLTLKGDTFLSGGPTSNPSRLRAAFLVVSDAELDDLAPGQLVGRAIAEFMCIDHQCIEVTTTLVIPRSRLDDAAFIEQAVAYAIGLDSVLRPVGRYPLGHPDTETSTK